MACHGDRGQGFTAEWRKRAFGEDINCWVSKCHSANHPPQGFSLVRFIPQVIGSNTLQRFITAADLHDYLLAKLPWWNPGSLSSDEAWCAPIWAARLNSRLRNMSAHAMVVDMT